jgi:hypothetical protein
MPEIIKEFSQVEYLTVFNAILFGYVGAEFFQGWGNMIRSRKNLKNYWQHIMWTVLMFTLFIQNWYGIWPRIEFINVSVFYFLFSLAPIFIFHIISVILFPDFTNSDNYDLKKYYFDNIKYVYLLFGGYLLLAILNSFVYPDIGDVFLQSLIRLFGLVLCILAVIFHKVKSVNIVFLIIGYLAVLVFLFALPHSST